MTLVEALMLGRKAIHIDVNPLSEFIVKNLIEPVDLAALGEAFRRVKAEFEQTAPKTKDEIDKALKVYLYPTGAVLPKNSDVETIEKLFSKKQLAQLAYLKFLIRREKIEVRGCLMLMFSGLLNKVNLTYHSSESRSEGGGDSSIFRYYRYRIAPKPADIDMMKYFESRFKKVVAGKRDLAGLINASTVQNAKVFKGTATDLSSVPSESIDYIYTDPPYGSKIPYLDLSIMWNEWLDLPVRDEDYANEAIEGGEAHKTKQDYSALLAQSIKEMARVLKYDRWMSFVFAHRASDHSEGAKQRRRTRRRQSLAAQQKRPARAWFVLDFTGLDIAETPDLSRMKSFTFRPSNQRSCGHRACKQARSGCRIGLAREAVTE